MSGGTTKSSLGVVGTVLGSARESTEGGEGSLHRGVLAWGVGWMDGEPADPGGMGGEMLPEP